MKYTTLALLCCGALLSACDNSNDTTSEAEPGLMDKANSLASESASLAKDVAEKAADGVDSAMESTKQATSKVVDSAKQGATDAMAAGKDLTQAAAEGASEAASEAVVAVKEVSTAAAAKTGEVIASVTGGDNARGEAVYKKHCVACHGSGVAGSPKLSDKAAWSARIAQGDAVMTKHAIEGFKGATGYMPPKGGFMSLSDDDIAATVKYMVSQVK